MQTGEFIAAMSDNSGLQPERLLQYLYDIQQEFGCIPPDSIAQLAHKLALSETHIRAVCEFYSFLHTGAPRHYAIRFSDNITDQMAGSEALRARLRTLLDAVPYAGYDNKTTLVTTTSCTGMCDQGPALLINDRPLPRLTAERIEQIAQLIRAGKPLAQWPQELFQVEDNIRRRDLLLADNTDMHGPLQSYLALGRESTLARISNAGLRGRGGAGFDTASKWRFCQQAAADQRYVVCNADEGEPGTFKDRVLLTRHAGRIFDGMTICAGVIGATRGFVYLRAEYAYLRDALEATVQERRRAGLLGKAILGSRGFDFEIEIRMGAGAYICGEESALLESLEGKRGIPRRRPPFPVTSGYLGKPTVVNNVETFIAAALITAHGADWFSRVGTEQSRGSKLLSVSGDCARPGIYEYPFGVSISRILADCGAENTFAVQVAGAAGNLVPESEFQRKIAFEDLSTGGSFMIFDRTRDPLAIIANFAAFFEHESCGFCTPCRVGNGLICRLLQKLRNRHATGVDLDEIRNIAALMRTSSHCGLGKSAPTALLDLLDKFPESVDKQLRNTSYEPDFNLDAALQEARELTGRDDPAAHV